MHLLNNGMLPTHLPGHMLVVDRVTGLLQCCASS